MKLSKYGASVITPVFVTLFAVSSSFAQEKIINEKDLPSAVTKAFHMKYPNAKIIGTAKETEKGITYFEIESKDSNMRRDLLYTKEGKVVEIEEELSAENIPSFVKAAVEEKFKDVEYKRGEKNVRNNVTKYEVVCDVKGKILKTTKLKNEKSDENDND